MVNHSVRARERIHDRNGAILRADERGQLPFRMIIYNISSCPFIRDIRL